MENRFEKFTLLILEINRSIQRIKTAEMARFNLKGVHAICLYYLIKSHNLSQAELVRLSGEDKAYVSRALAELENKGLIEIEQTRGLKKHNAAITLTEKGEKTAEAVCGRVEAALDAGGMGLDDADRKKLYAFLELINKNLDKYYNGYDD